MTNSYNVGDAVRVTASFSNLIGVLADPTTIVCRVKDPTGFVSVLTNNKVSTGVYYADIPVNVSGLWTYRWEGTGAVIAAVEGHLVVQPSSFS